jgi:hypothetical protein
VLLDVALERHAGAQFHDVTGQCDAVVGVGGQQAGRADPGGLVCCEVLAERPASGARVAGVALLESRGVREQVRQCDRPAGKGVRHLEPGQVVVHVAVQVELAAGDELHRRRGREHLADRVEVDGGSVVERTARVEVGDAVAPREHLPPARHDGDRGPWQLQPLQLLGHDAVHERPHRAGIERVRGRGPRTAGRADPADEQTDDHREDNPDSHVSSVTIGAWNDQSGQPPGAQGVNPPSDLRRPEPRSGRERPHLERGRLCPGEGYTQDWCCEKRPACRAGRRPPAGGCVDR